MRQIYEVLRLDSLRQLLSKLFQQNKASSNPGDEVDRLLTNVCDRKGDSALYTRSNAGPNVLLPRRLQLAGIDPDYVEAFEPETFEEIRRKCSVCGETQRCARDLTKGDVQSGLEHYCPNTVAIDELILSK